MLLRKCIELTDFYLKFYPNTLLGLCLIVSKWVYWFACVELTLEKGEDIDEKFIFKYLVGITV